MQKFLGIPQEFPDTYDPEKRKNNFDEIYVQASKEFMAKQASRCEQCGNPGCEIGCPLGNYILDWLRYTAEGQFELAHKLSQETNNLPEICGRICPQDRLCESNCILDHTGEGTVTIGAIEKFINDRAVAKRYVYTPNKAPKNGKKVAVIGSGPAGLACADELIKKGYDVTVFEKALKPGGLLTFGIPNFKLEKKAVEKRIKLLEEKGIEFKCNTEVGKDVTIDELKEQGFDAFFLGFGTYRANRLECPGHDLPVISLALPYLIATNFENMGDDLTKEQKEMLDVKGKRIVVLGGGDTAMDCVRTSVRRGAAEVTCVYRRDEENMPGSRREVKHAKEEGVKFRFLAVADSIRLSGNGSQKKIIDFSENELSEPAPDGRRSVVPKKGGGFKLEADLILVAYGFKFSAPKFLEELGIKLSAKNRIMVNRHKMTTVPGFFAGGDCVRGADLVVTAIADGRDAATGIHRYFTELPGYEPAEEAA